MKTRLEFCFEYLLDLLIDAAKKGFINLEEYSKDLEDLEEIKTKYESFRRRLKFNK